MIVAVTGGRHFRPTAAVEAAFVAALRIWSPPILRHGAARGADTWAALVAAAVGGITIEPWPADWTRYGKAAGPIRNRVMLIGARDVGHAQLFARADLLVALPGGRGTADCVRAAGDLGISVVSLDKDGRWS